MIQLIPWLISRRQDQKKDSEERGKNKVFYIEVSAFIIVMFLFGGHVAYSAIPYHGALPWKTDEWEHKDEENDAESWTFDQSDGTMCYLSDDYNGWRLTVADAAAGSRFYVMEKTVDGGVAWECINNDPFSGQSGVAEGLIFYDENLGFAGLAGASQSHSTLYITRNGGISFEEIELPMSTVTTDAVECDGIVFQSIDDGFTWKYSGRNHY